MARFHRLGAVFLTTVIALAARPQAQNAPAAPAAPSGQQSPPAATDQPPAPGQAPVFRTGINFVRVDVIVSDKAGNPVGDLKPEDFEISEQGKQQKVETFKLVSLDGGVLATATEVTSTTPETATPGVVSLPMTCHSGGSVEIHIQPVLPPPRLLVYGLTPTARALVRLGSAMLTPGLLKAVRVGLDTRPLRAEIEMS